MSRLSDRQEVLARERAVQDRLYRSWIAWRQDEVRTALAGEHGPALRALIERCRAVPWRELRRGEVQALVAGTGRDVEALGRRLVSAFIAAGREREGLEPFSDPVPF